MPTRKQGRKYRAQKTNLVYGRPGERVTEMEEITRLQVPKWNAALAQKQLAAIAMLRTGHNFKAVICCLSFSVPMLMFAAFVALAPESNAEENLGITSFLVVGPFVLTSIALGMWIPAANALAPAFGGYDGGQPGASLYLIVMSIVFMVSVIGSEWCSGAGGSGIINHTSRAGNVDRRNWDPHNRWNSSGLRGCVSWPVGRFVDVLHLCGFGITS